MLSASLPYSTVSFCRLHQLAFLDSVSAAGSLPRPYTIAVIAPAPNSNAVQGPYKPIPTGILPSKTDNVATTNVYGLVVRTCSPSPQPGANRGGGGRSKGEYDQVLHQFLFFSDSKLGLIQAESTIERKPRHRCLEQAEEPGTASLRFSAFYADTC